MIISSDASLMTLTKQSFDEILGVYNEYVVGEKLCFL